MTKITRRPFTPGFSARTEKLTAQRKYALAKELRTNVATINIALKKGIPIEDISTLLEIQQNMSVNTESGKVINPAFKQIADMYVKYKDLELIEALVAIANKHLLDAEGGERKVFYRKRYEDLAIVGTIDEVVKMMDAKDELIETSLRQTIETHVAFLNIRDAKRGIAATFKKVQEIYDRTQDLRATEEEMAILAG